MADAGMATWAAAGTDASTRSHAARTAKASNRGRQARERRMAKAPEVTLGLSTPVEMTPNARQVNAPPGRCTRPGLLA